MQYELKDATWVGSPIPKKDDPTKVEVYVNVTTGIVGQAYTGFTNQDTTKMEFPMSMTGTQMQADTQIQAAAYSAAKYPNT
jgi:hypothetical protein